MLYRHCFTDLLQSMLLKRVQVNPYGLKLNVTCQVLIYADVNILGYGVNAVKKKRNL